MNNLYNILVDTIGVFIIGVVLVAGRLRKRRGGETSTRLFNGLTLCCMLVFLTDIPGLLLDGADFFGARVLLWLLDSAYWVFQILYCWLWLLFVDCRMNVSQKLSLRRVLCFAIPMAAELLLIATNPVTGWVFTLDSANVYKRSEVGYLPNFIPYVMYILASVFHVLLGNRKSGDPEIKRCRLSLLAYMLLPACGAVFEALFYGISWLWPMVAISLLMVYINTELQSAAAEQLAAAKLEAELTEGRVAVMMSQIQPHFLYNSLNTIDALCDIDTKAAQNAIRSFAKYLRGNLDALSRKTTVPFREELSHLRYYMTLETFRFENIEIYYDLEIVDFMLPPLSLQPIVENAVKHGILKRREGGSVTVSTRNKKDYIQLVIRDDGVGFDTSKDFGGDGRTHIGLANVQSRIEAMCGGTLTVESTPDVGTIVTVILPKDRAEK